MSFPAYLDAIEKRTGKTPQELLDEAHARGFGPETKAGEVITWLAGEYGLGRGHAMALAHVVRNGPEISEKHVGTDGTHRDESTMLRRGGGTVLPIADRGCAGASASVSVVARGGA